MSIAFYCESNNVGGILGQIYPFNPQSDDSVIGCSEDENSEQDPLNTAFTEDIEDEEIQYRQIMSEEDRAIFFKCNKLYNLLENDVKYAFREKTDKNKPRNILRRDSACFLRHFRSPYGEYWVRTIMYHLMVTERQGPEHRPYYHNVEFDGTFYQITICKCPAPEKK